VLLLLGAAIGLALGLATGGDIRNLTARRVRWAWLVIAALAVRVVIDHTPLAEWPGSPWLYAAALAALVGWALWHRRRLPGIELVALGMAMNLAAMLANAGHMPVAPALTDRGPAVLAEQGTWAQYVVASARTHLNALGDYVPLPGPLGRLFPQAYSPGDLVSLVGMAVMLFLTTRPLGLRDQPAIARS
jgi:hypothetical protein